MDGYKILVILFLMFWGALLVYSFCKDSRHAGSVFGAKIGRNHCLGFSEAVNASF